MAASSETRLQGQQSSSAGPAKKRRKSILPFGLDGLDDILGHNNSTEEQTRAQQMELERVRMAKRAAAKKAKAEKQAKAIAEARLRANWGRKSLPLGLEWMVSGASGS